MILFYKNTINSPSAMIALTGLTKSEFNALPPAFEKAEEEHVKEKNMDKERKRKPGGGRRPKLRTAGERLFFILFYFKIYPLQQVTAILFGLSLSQADFWIHRLSMILKSPLCEGSYLPGRNPSASGKALKKCSGLSFVTGCTGRRIYRPKDPEKRKKFCNGKKKCHTVKNNIIADAAAKKVIYLSGTYEGKKHDKKISDEENPAFPEGGRLFKDTGYQGYEPEGTICHQPSEKPRGKQLSSEDRIFNKMISGVRIIAENVTAGIKRLHIVSDVFRNRKESFSDLVMEIACALHNLRVTFRTSDSIKKDPEPIWH